MTETKRFQAGGFCLAVGAAAFAVHLVARSLLTAGAEATSAAAGGLWVPVNALGFAGAVSVLLGFPALLARTAGRTERPDGAASLGLALIAIAWTFFGVFLSLYAALLMPWFAREAPRLLAGAPLPASFLVAFLAALLLWAAGAVLLAVPFLRGRLRPSWVGYLAVLSGLWMILGNLVLAPSGPAENLALNLISNLGPVPLLAGLAFLGLRPAPETERPGP